MKKRMSKEFIHYYDIWLDIMSIFVFYVASATWNFCYIGHKEMFVLWKKWRTFNSFDIDIKAGGGKEMSSIFAEQ